jgi:uncharacterized protein (TIGR03083 family)
LAVSRKGRSVPEMVEVWSRVSGYRLELAERVEPLEQADLDAPSWCEGWRVRDVIGHLVHLAEATQLTMATAIARNGLPPDRALAAVARQLGQLSGSQLAERLRGARSGRFHVIGTPSSVALGEVLVHAEDALRPIGQTLAASPDDVAPVLGVYRRVGGLAFHRRSLPKICLRADDADWKAGQGPDVTGKAIDLLLLLANRRQVVGSLAGEGARLLG